MKVTLFKKEVRLKKPSATTAKIRAIHPEDVGEVCALQDFAVDSSRAEKWMIATTDDFQDRLKNGMGLACVADGMLVGYSFAVHKGDYRCAPLLGYEGLELFATLEICEMVVHPEYRGNGLQAVMLENIEDIARQVGMRRILCRIAQEDSYSFENLSNAGFVSGLKIDGKTIMQKILG